MCVYSFLRLIRDAGQFTVCFLSLKAWETGASSSLFGTATPSVQVGQRQRKFAQVSMNNNDFETGLLINTHLQPCVLKQIY